MLVKLWPQAIWKNEHKTALLCSVCQLPWCKYSHRGWFHATNVMSLNSELERDVHWLLWTSESQLPILCYSTKIECKGKSKSEYKEKILEFRIITQINNSREILKDTFKGSSHYYTKLVKFLILVENNFVSITSLYLSCFS